MQEYQRHFIEFLLKHKALSFGEFTLKSGRISPYFFNLGTFQSGSSLAQLGEFYAASLLQSNLPYDMLYGPAYKGIPLVAATVIALYNQHEMDIPYCFNRKEVKDHGDKGRFVGASMAACEWTSDSEECCLMPSNSGDLPTDDPPTPPLLKNREGKNRVGSEGNPPPVRLFFWASGFKHATVIAPQALLRLF